jgi:hypothetical protein
MADKDTGTLEALLRMLGRDPGTPTKFTATPEPWLDALSGSAKGGSVSDPIPFQKSGTLGAPGAEDIGLLQAMAQAAPSAPPAQGRPSILDQETLRVGQSPQFVDEYVRQITGQ